MVVRWVGDSWSLFWRDIGGDFKGRVKPAIVVVSLSGERAS